jgi:hypothetical protein
MNVFPIGVWKFSVSFGTTLIDGVFSIIVQKKYKVQNLTHNLKLQPDVDTKQ